MVYDYAVPSGATRGHYKEALTTDTPRAGLLVAAPTGTPPLPPKKISLFLLSAQLRAAPGWRHGSSGTLPPHRGRAGVGEV